MWHSLVAISMLITLLAWLLYQMIVVGLMGFLLVLAFLRRNLLWRRLCFCVFNELLRLVLYLWCVVDEFVVDVGVLLA